MVQRENLILVSVSLQGVMMQPASGTKEIHSHMTEGSSLHINKDFWGQKMTKNLLQPTSLKVISLISTSFHSSSPITAKKGNLCCFLGVEGYSLVIFKPNQSGFVKKEKIIKMFPERKSNTATQTQI